MREEVTPRESERQKMQFYLHPDDVEDIKEVVGSTRYGSMADFLREAIGVYLTIVPMIQNGARLCICGEDGRTQELVLSGDHRLRRRPSAEGQEPR